MAETQMDPAQRWYNWPIIIAIIATLTMFGGVILGYILTKKPVMIISYTVFPSEKYSTSLGTGGKPSTINAFPVPKVVVHMARIWNSGDATIDSPKIMINFEKADGAARLLTLGHAPQPELGFGKIMDDNSGYFPTSIEYEYLNRRDEDTLLILTDKAGKVIVLPRGKGVQSREVTVGSKKGLTFVASMIAFGCAGLAIVFAFRVWAMKLQ